METSLGTMEWSAALDPIREGEPSGDAWVCRPRGEGVLIGVIDALGHGAPAAEVAFAMVQMGLTLEGVTTTLDLEEALEHLGERSDGKVAR